MIWRPEQYYIHTKEPPLTGKGKDLGPDIRPQTVKGVV